MTALDEAQLALSDRGRAAQDKARILQEALPWITHWAGRTVVVKVGGSVGRGTTAETMEQGFAADVALLRSVGLRVVVVHGGGPQISHLADRLGLSSTFVDGRRVTDADMLDVVRLVLLGQVNPRLVGLVSQAGARAIGVAGTDANLITARPADPALGFVGEIDAVDPGVLRSLLDDGVVPVVATVARARDGQDYNINADTVAGAIATALGADKLIYLTNVAGLYEAFGSGGSQLLSQVDVHQLRAMLADGTIVSGMIPKIASCVDAIEAGVGQAHLLDGRLEHALLLEIFTDAGVGTMIVGDGAAAAPLAAAEPGSAEVRPVTGALERLRAREATSLMHTYARQPVAFASGSGVWLTDVDGRRYLDALSGLAVTGLGHAHPAVTEAIATQAAILTHTSNLYFTEPQIALAERIGGLTGWSDARVFFSNSGAEAIEAALKLARLHGKRRDPEAIEVVALSGGFHGRTLGALLATGNPDKHRPFAPLGDWVTHVPHDDPAALDAAVGPRTNAVLLEVVQGEAGVVPLSNDMLRTARAACDRVGALLVVDEVQTGIGRLGSWFGWQTAVEGPPVQPDVMTLAKGLANGLPIGAVVARGEAAKVFEPGHHATTFGGGPVVCAAVLAVLDTIERDGLLDHVVRVGARVADGVADLAARHRLVTGIRGRALLRAVTLSAARADAVAAAALEAGLLVNPVRPDAIRLAPPLIISDDEVDELLSRLDAALKTVEDKDVA